jgi:hypothetical protein
MFCQWCGKQRDESSDAIHHCGPKSRPPAHCIACGTALAGAPDCPSCGLGAGVVPVPAMAAAAAAPAVGAGSASASEPAPLEGPRFGSVPVSQQANGAAPGAPVRVAHPPRRHPEERNARFLRSGIALSAAAAAVACFLDWLPGMTGMSMAQIIPDITWWQPASPRVVFGGVVILFAFAVLSTVLRSRMLDWLVGFIGLATTAFTADWIWYLAYTTPSRISNEIAQYGSGRPNFALAGGLWVVLAASVVATGFAFASATDR